MISIEKENAVRQRTSSVGLLILLFVMPAIYAVAVRDAWVGTDTQNYIDFFERTRSCGCFQNDIEFLFGGLAWLVAEFNGSSKFFFGLISAIQFFSVFLLEKILCNNLKYDKASAVFCLTFKTQYFSCL